MSKFKITWKSPEGKVDEGTLNSFDEVRRSITALSTCSDKSLNWISKFHLELTDGAVLDMVRQEE